MTFSEKQISFRTESEIKLTSFRPVTFEKYACLRVRIEMEHSLALFPCGILYSYTFSLLYRRRVAALALAQGCNVSLVLLWCYSVLLIIKVSHMSLASPQEHHLTWKGCISALRWRAWERGPCALCSHGALADGGRCPLEAQQPENVGPSKQSGSSSCREYVSSSQI